MINKTVDMILTIIIMVFCLSIVGFEIYFIEKYGLYAGFVFGLFSAFCLYCLSIYFKTIETTELEQKGNKK